MKNIIKDLFKVASALDAKGHEGFAAAIDLIAEDFIYIYAVDSTPLEEKLLARIVGGGSTPAEQETALLKLEELLKKKGISLSEYLGTKTKFLADRGSSAAKVMDSILPTPKLSPSAVRPAMPSGSPANIPLGGGERLSLPGAAATPGEVPLPGKPSMMSRLRGVAPGAAGIAGGLAGGALGEDFAGDLADLAGVEGAGKTVMEGAGMLGGGAAGANAAAGLVGGTAVAPAAAVASAFLVGWGIGRVIGKYFGADKLMSGWLDSLFGLDTQEVKENFQKIISMIGIFDKYAAEIDNQNNPLAKRMLKLEGAINLVNNIVNDAAFPDLPPELQSKFKGIQADLNGKPREALDRFKSAPAAVSSTGIASPSSRPAAPTAKAKKQSAQRQKWVKDLQHDLNTLIMTRKLEGIDLLEEDGLYGKKTRAAVKAFNPSSNGIVTKELIKEISDAVWPEVGQKDRAQKRHETEKI